MKPGKKELHREGTKKWRETNKEKWKDGMLRNTYGISLEGYHEMREQQNYCCAICGTHETLATKARATKTEWTLQVDHCHTTGAIRSLLCSSCNILLSKAKEDIEILEKAKLYLKQWTEKL
jgi:hypothetical protein